MKSTREVKCHMCTCFFYKKIYLSVHLIFNQRQRKLILYNVVSHSVCSLLHSDTSEMFGMHTVFAGNDCRNAFSYRVILMRLVCMFNFRQKDSQTYETLKHHLNIVCMCIFLAVVSFLRQN